MKILQLCKKFPYPPKDGESIAILNLSKSLVDSGCQVDLLAMNTSRHHVDVDRVIGDMKHYRKIETVEVDNRLNIKDAFQNLVRGKSYHISRFESVLFEQKLTRLLEENDYDVIQLETLYLTPYLETIRLHSEAVVAMRAHNVEYEIWEKIADNTRFLPKKWYLRKLTDQLQKYEIKHLNDFDFLIAISQEDLGKFKRMGYLNGAVSTPVGVPLGEYQQHEVSCTESRSMSFIGSLDWMPNLEGLHWFLDKVMPSIEDVHLHVAGRSTPESLKSRSSERIHIHGEVDDAHAFIREHPVMVVPLLSGSGMRVKILEGMALGKTIITTSKGAEGIQATPDVHFKIADTPEQFIQAIHQCYEQPERTLEMGRAARAFIEKEYDSVNVARQLKSAYEYVLSAEYSVTKG